MAPADLHGLLVIDKPGLALNAPPEPGLRLPTSHDIVQRVRRLSGQRRIGHTGTLDPMASGVLVLCLGVATRLVEYYQGHDKTYRAEVTLGAATDTYDALGAVIARHPLPALDVEQIEAALDHFRGEILQRPPIYSALKQGGESLHRKARRGEAVQVQPRRVTIHRLELLAFLPPDRVRLEIVCSAGVYVRSLAHDLGERLGVGGHLSYLRRTAVGPFTLEHAHTLETIEAHSTAGALQKLMLPLGAGLAFPALSLDEALQRRIGHGQKVWLPALEAGRPAVGDLLQARDAAGAFLGLLRVLEIASPEEGGQILCKAEKWLAPIPNSSPTN